MMRVQYIFCLLPKNAYTSLLNNCESLSKIGVEEKFFDASVSKPTVTSDARKAAQKSVDAALEANISKVEFLSAYLKAKFSLSKGDKPHLLKF